MIDVTVVEVGSESSRGPATECNAPAPIISGYPDRDLEPEGLAFVPPFLEGHGAVVCDHHEDLAGRRPAVRIRDFKSRLNRRFGASASGLHAAQPECFSWTQVHVCMLPTLPRPKAAAPKAAAPLRESRRA